MGSFRSRTLVASTTIVIAILLILLAYFIPIATKQEFVCITDGEAKPTRYSLIFGQKNDFDSAVPPERAIILCVGDGVEANLFVI